MRAAAAGAALILGIMTSLTGCSSTGSSSDPSPVGTWGDLDIAYLELGEDGALTGSDGCNRLMGSWESEGATVTFIGVASTMRACEDVDDWLGRLDTATVGQDELTVFNVDGQQIGVLGRN